MIERLITVLCGLTVFVYVAEALHRRYRLRIYRMKAVAASRNTGGRMDPRNEQQKQGDPGSVTRQQGTVGRRPGTPGSDREYAEINQRFTPRVLLGDDKQRFNELMFATKDLGEKVIQFIPNSAERAIALDKLEEFTHWCESGIAHGLTSGVTSGITG